LKVDNGSTKLWALQAPIEWDGGRGKGTPMGYLRKARANAMAIKGKASIAKG
jgi:hypothetical protein